MKVLKGIVQPRLTLLLLFWSMFAAFEAPAQSVHVSIETKSVDGPGLAGVKVWIGPRFVTTAAGGVAEMEVPVGTFKAKAETKCRVVQATASSNLMPGGSTELNLTFRVPQDLPAGILFKLDCKGVQQTKIKVGRKKPKT
jgi:hypothetical protein